MLQRLLGKLTFANLIALIALFVALGGGAYAVSSSGNGTVFNACVKKDGSLKIVKKAKCPKGQKAISWNQKGVAGAPGAPGPATGPAGGDLTGNYPNPTIGAGKVTAANLGTIPQARVENPAPLSVPDGFEIPNSIPSWQTAAFDTAHLFNPSKPTLLTAPIAGVYQIDAGIRWAAKAGGARFISICVNAGTECDITSNAAVTETGTPSTGARATQQTVTTLVKLSAGDTVEAALLQESGAALEITTNVTANFLAMTWVGKG